MTRARPLRQPRSDFRKRQHQQPVSNDSEHHRKQYARPSRKLRLGPLARGPPRHPYTVEMRERLPQFKRAIEAVVGLAFKRMENRLLELRRDFSTKTSRRRRVLLHFCAHGGVDVVSGK